MAGRAAAAPSRTRLITLARPRSSSAAYIDFTRSKTARAAASCCSRVGSSTRSKVIGSPYWTVTLGNTSRFHARTLCEPWIATGTTGTPDSSASRPTPGFASPSLPVRDRPPSE